MPEVYVGAGSNVQPAENLARFCDALEEIYGPLRISPVYRSAALGAAGDDFLNLVAGFRCREDIDTLHSRLAALQARAGRVAQPAGRLARTLDVDLLLYGDAIVRRGPITVPRSDVTEFSFVLRSLADIAPTLAHPQSGLTMAALWARFDPAAHPLQRAGRMLRCGAGYRLAAGEDDSAPSR